MAGILALLMAIVIAATTIGTIWWPDITVRILIVATFIVIIFIVAGVLLTPPV